MNEFVLDCSVTMAWCFENELDPKADGLLRSMSNLTACVPAIWMCEVANALVVGERRGRLTAMDVSLFVSRLYEIPIEQEAATERGGFDRVLALAKHHGLSAYDAAYLELAIRRGIPLATLDMKLRQAAQSAGVKPAL